MDTINAPADYCLSTWYSHAGFIAGEVVCFCAAIKYAGADPENVWAMPFISAIHFSFYHYLKAAIPSLRSVALGVPVVLLALMAKKKAKAKVFIGGSVITLASLGCAAVVNVIVQKALLAGK